MSLDHGVLNVPLAKRGNIDAQLDRYKKQQFTIREYGIRDARKRHVALVAEAKELTARVTDERMAELGKPHGMTAKQCRKEWSFIASGKPELVIQVMRKELGEQP